MLPFFQLPFFKKTQGLFFKRGFIFVLASSAILLSSCRYFAKKPLSGSKPLVGGIMRDIPFWPINEERFRLSELEDKKAFVIVMKTAECPLSKQSNKKLLDLEKAFTPAVKFIHAYVPKQNEDLEKSRRWAEKDLKTYQFNGAYIIDSRLKVANALGAKKANEVFVLTPERRIIYRGPVEGLILNKNQEETPIFNKNMKKATTLKALVAGKNPQALSLPVPNSCPLPYPILKETVFFEDTAPIIQKKCAVCHNPKGQGPMDFITYKDIVGRGKMFRYVIENDLMPPWHLDPNTGPWRDDLSLTAYEKALLLKWAEQGFLKQRANFLFNKSKPLKYPKDISMQAVPHYKISLPKSVKIPAQGLSNYKFFFIPAPFSEEKWIKSATFYPLPKAVHHIAVYILRAPSQRESIIKELEDRSFLQESLNTILHDPRGPAPYHYNTQNIHKNAGIRWPAGSPLVLEIHYESKGKEFIDSQTQVHIRFYKEKPKYRIIFATYESLQINIPPNQPNHKTESVFHLKETMPLVEIKTHAHLRGKASAVLITDPSGRTKRILGEDPYHIQFERFYQPEKPLMLQNGSTIVCRIWHDNSSKNPQNPNPAKSIKWGLMLKDEMAMCFLKWLLPNEREREREGSQDKHSEKDLRINIQR